MIGMKVERINVKAKARPQQPVVEEPVMRVERIEKPAKKAPEPEIKAKSVPKPSSGPAMSVAMAEQFPWTTTSMAEELGMPVPSFRSWKMKAEQDGKLAKPAKNSLLCIIDPENPTRLRFSDAYLEKLKALRGTVARRQEQNVSALQHAKMKVMVPIFDEQVAKFLTKKFKDQTGIEDYLKDHLFSLAKPALNKIEELKKKFEADMKALMGDF